MDNKQQVILREDRGQVVLDRPSGPVPVRLVWARPISGRGQEVALLDEKGREVLMLRGLDELDPDSRRLAEAELERRYLIARISRVYRTAAREGSRYWDVQTDRGRRRFAMKDPNRNIAWVTDDHLIIRDTLGNRYEIRSLAELDPYSCAQINKVT